MPITFQYKPGLVAYITCGDPDLETSREAYQRLVALSTLGDSDRPERAEAMTFVAN